MWRLGIEEGSETLGRKVGKGLFGRNRGSRGRVGAGWLRLVLVSRSLDLRTLFPLLGYIFRGLYLQSKGVAD